MSLRPASKATRMFFMRTTGVISRRGEAGKDSEGHRARRPAVSDRRVEHFDQQRSNDETHQTGSCTA